MILVVVAFRNVLGLGISKESSGNVMSENDAIRYAITQMCIRDRYYGISLQLFHHTLLVVVIQ